MNTMNSPRDADNQPTPTNLSNPRVIKVIQTLSWVITLIFLLALMGAIYQAVVNGNPLPVWAWLGFLILLAVAIGLGVAFVVYRGVVAQTGPFDFRPSTNVTGELKRETRQVEVDEASRLGVDINMTAGILQLMGGTTDVMDAQFTYDDADWKQPLIEYAVDAAGQGNLVVEQGATHRPAMRPGRCEWHICLSQHLPTELNVKFGAGKADLRLAGLRLTRLKVESGVGELTLDLGGQWIHDLEAFIKSGIGDTVIRLPQDVGVRVQSTVGLGSIHPHGLIRNGQAYTNALYGHAGANLELTIEGGIGKISLE